MTEYDDKFELKLLRHLLQHLKCPSGCVSDNLLERGTLYTINNQQPNQPTKQPRKREADAGCYQSTSHATNLVSFLLHHHQPFKDFSWAQSKLLQLRGKLQYVWKAVENHRGRCRHTIKLEIFYSVLQMYAI